MKWSQGLCAAILIDELQFLPPVGGPNPRWERDFPDVSPEPASTPNTLAADWGLSPEAGRTPVPTLAKYGLIRLRIPSFMLKS